MKEENQEVKIEVKEEDQEMEISVKEENHQIKTEVKEKDDDKYPEQAHLTQNTTNQVQPVVSSRPSGLQMTMPKNTSRCPICRKPLAAISQHLRHAHRVRNTEERAILLKMAARRINVRAEPCPVSGCSYGGPRCDSHLSGAHPELLVKEVKRQVDMLKERVGVRLLRKLRATNPSPPLSSTLDLGPECEQEADLVPHKGPQHFDCAGCKKLYNKVRKAKEELSELRAFYRLLCRQYRRLKKRNGARHN